MTTKYISHEKCQENKLLNYLYPPVNLCKKTNIVTLAILIPKHVRGPDPNGI